MEVTLGGDRLGSGNKQKVEMHNYQMTSFNLEQDFKSSMAPGVLYPFIKMVGTNHGTFDIDLDSFVRTLPTKGPLFGSFKLQVDLFSVPMRLYQAILHNNPQKIGMKMNQVYLPKLRLSYNSKALRVKGSNKYNWQVNNSSLLKYLGLSGIGTNVKTEGEGELVNIIERKVNAIPALAYYDIFKCYYSNKQEENAYVIKPKELKDVLTGIEQIIVCYQENVGLYFNPGYEIPASADTPILYFNLIFKDKEEWENIKEFATIETSNITGTVDQLITGGYFKTVVEPVQINRDGETYYGHYRVSLWPGEDLQDDIMAGEYLKVSNEIIPTTTDADIELKEFKLQNIDDMRNKILSKNNFGQEFIIGNLLDDWSILSGSDSTGLPYSALIQKFDDANYRTVSWNSFALNGLCVKTYQSDLFNNWLDTEWIDGEEGIAALTAISTSDGKFTVDSFVFAEKLYDIYNRIATGGGTYEDWQEAVYGEGAVRKAETPMYIGGMAAEIMFEEVISSAETNVGGDFQALGSLGGKGTQVGSKGGHNIHVKCEEPSYIMGIVSLTPRICYNQGNDWDVTELDSMDDLHKPGMDGIGFQDLIVENMAWWNTRIKNNNELERDSAGKQTAWIQYQTAIDKSYADFANTDGYGFMVLNRNYEMDDETPGGVTDLTTYIDPRKYNYAFAYNELAAQNFWVQIHSKVVARRKMGAQQIPNL